MHVTKNLSSQKVFSEGEQLEMIDVRPLPTTQESSGTINGALLR